jgi:hypothetical protein
LCIAVAQVSYKLLILENVQHTQRGRCNQWLTREQHPDITILALLPSGGWYHDVQPEVKDPDGLKEDLVREWGSFVLSLDHDTSANNDD